MSSRLSAVIGVLPLLAAVFELMTRTVAGSTVAVGSVGAPTRSLHVGDAEVSFQAVILLNVLAIAATLPPILAIAAVATVTVTAANVLMIGLFHTVTVGGACMQIFALYRFGRTGAQVMAPALAAPFLVLALVYPGRVHSETEIMTVLLASLGPAAAWAGLAHRTRYEALARSAEKDSIASSLLEDTARRERARIARELHDVVAHHISVITVQAETARVATPDMPDIGARRLLEIGDTARSALTEMRRLLGILRDDARSVAYPDFPGLEQPNADRRPQPGLQQLNELLDEARNASMTGVRLIVSGSPATLDPGVELAAYRIIQEALTNARRHAPGAAVDVELHYTIEALRLRIRDNGPGPPRAPTVESAAGHGMLGMRERAVAVGGRLHTGAAGASGFLVEATLPAKAETEVIA